MKYRKELNEQERKLRNSLGKIYDAIKRDMSLELKAGRLSWSEIMRIYKRRSDDSIRASIEEIYRLAAKKTAERDARVPFFLTQTDRQEMNSLIGKYSDWYWTGLEREIVKKTAMAFDPRSLLRFQTALELKDTFLGRMTGSIVAEVTGTAVIAKSRQILPTKPLRLRMFRQAATDEFSGTVVSGPHFVWRTADDTGVCEICTPLDNSQYAVDDPDIPVPVSGTHINCRCEIELVDAEFSGDVIYEDIGDLEGIQV